MTDSTSSKSPISFRPTEQERALIEELSTAQGESTSSILRKGLELAARQQVTDTRMPFYALEVDSSEVHAAVEEAADAACAALDGLMRRLGSKYPERDGIDSNFRGLLGDHIKAMLSGREHGSKTYSTPLKPLFAHYRTFGMPPSTKAQQGYTFRKAPNTIAGEPLYFSGENQWVLLNAVDIGTLYTSQEAAIAGLLKHFRDQGLTMRDTSIELVVVDFSDEKRNVVV